MKTLVAFAASLAACAALAQQDFSKVEIKATQLSPTTWMLTGAGGNLGLSAGDDATFLIDDQYAPLSEKITAAIAKITPKPVKFVVNTHWHSDHTGGNENLAKAGVVIVAHDNVYRRMSTDQFIELFKMKEPASPHVALPMVTFGVGVTFHLNGEDIQVLHVAPAHTDGDAIIYFPKSNVVHMGDTYFAGMYPFVDTSSGGRIDGMVAACDKALSLGNDDTKIIPGHGPLSNKADLKAWRDMLAAISAKIHKLVADGKNVEEIVAANPTAEFDAKYGGGFVKPPKFAEMIALNVIKNP
jgi:glyoxylase-like metal-dependent hydrolase (beta-lactamase superfamily II)